LYKILHWYLWFHTNIFSMKLKISRIGINLLPYESIRQPNYLNLTQIRACLGNWWSQARVTCNGNFNKLFF
jgi:hypothetical protein